MVLWIWVPKPATSSSCLCWSNSSCCGTGTIQEDKCLQGSWQQRIRRSCISGHCHSLPLPLKKTNKKVYCNAVSKKAQYQLFFFFFCNNCFKSLKTVHIYIHIAITLKTANSPQNVIVNDMQCTNKSDNLMHWESNNILLDIVNRK